MTLSRFVIIFISLMNLSVAKAENPSPAPSSNPWQAPEPTAFQLHEGFSVSPFIGLNIGNISNTNSDARFTPSGGAAFSYFFNPIVGLELNAQLMSRGFAISSLSATTTYLDLGLGVTLNPGPNGIFKTSRPEIFIGPFLGIPFGDFSGSLPLTFSASALSVIGLEVTAQQEWAISEKFGLGYRIWVKYGFKSVVEGASRLTTSLDAGLGLVVSYLN